MRIALLSAACLACGMASAATPVDGWYSSIFGGYTYFPDNLTRTIDNQLLNGASYRSGYNVGGRVGYQSNPLRYEGEFTYLHGDLKNFSVNQVNQNNVDGYNAAYLIMANIYYDFPEMLPAVAPFLGVGIGYANVEGLYESLPPNAPVFFKGTDGLFAYQATAGLTYNFSENYALNVAYRYVGTDRAEELGKVFEAHVASLGVVYRFDTCYK